MQTLHYEVLDLDEQIVSPEADLKAEDAIIEFLSWGQLSMDLIKPSLVFCLLISSLQWMGLYKSEKT